MSDFKFPSIEHPTQDMRSVHQSVLQLKENVEMITGQRKSGTPFVMASSMQAYDDQLAQLRAADAVHDTRLAAAEAKLASLAWDTIFDGPVTSITSKPFTNLSAYRTLKIMVYGQTDVTKNVFLLQMSANNGSSWIAASGDYRNELMYHDEATFATLSGTETTAHLGISSWRTVNNTALGIEWEMTISEFNQAHHKHWHGDLIVYDGTNILHGQPTGRSGSANTLVAMNAFRVTCATAFSGSILLLGRKG